MHAFFQHDSATLHTIFDPIHYNKKTCSEESIQNSVFSFSTAKLQHAMNSMLIAYAMCVQTEENHFQYLCFLW
jgi:hypothetical protein